jgi:hypothetical protein
MVPSWWVRLLPGSVVWLDCCGVNTKPSSQYNLLSTQDEKSDGTMVGSTTVPIVRSPRGGSDDRLLVVSHLTISPAAA